MLPPAGCYDKEFLLGIGMLDPDAILEKEDIKKNKIDLRNTKIDLYS